MKFWNWNTDVCKHCGKPIVKGWDSIPDSWIHTDGFYGCMNGSANRAEPERK